MELLRMLMAGGEDAVASCLRGSGPWALVLVFFVAATQTGFVLGPVLPGSTILFICGVLARSEPQSLNIVHVCLAGVLGGIAGSGAHYALGRWAGQKLFVKEKGLWSRQNLAVTEAFFERHGRASLILAPSVPVVRTFAAVVAGAAAMPPASFFASSGAGVVLWIATVAGAGYLTGIIPGARLWVLLGALCLSTAMGVRVAWKFLRERRMEQQKAPS